MNQVKRLWFGVSCYAESNQSIHSLIRSIRAAYPDPARFPIVLNEGRVRFFQQLDHGGEYEAGINWPSPAPNEFSKRTAYWAGRPGDAFMILDGDETLEVNDKDFWKDFDDPVKRVRIDYSDGEHQTNQPRLFTIQKDMHHWGQHVDVWAGDRHLTKRHAPVTEHVKIIHHDRPQPRDKDEYIHELASSEREYRKYTRFM